jgi:nitrite reductase (NADH) large subunit
MWEQFVNTGETEPTIEFIREREQKRPAAWKGSFIPSTELTLRKQNGDANLGPLAAPSLDQASAEPDLRWVQVGKTWNFPHDGGAAVKYGKTQIAVFNFASRNEWYATQNMCPHRREFVLSRGLIGDASGKPKVACPLHKKTYSLETGKCTTAGDDYSVRVFPVKIDGDDVYLHLPLIEELDAELATEKTCNGSTCQTADTPPKNRLPKRKAKAYDPFAVSTFGDPR